MNAKIARLAYRRALETEIAPFAEHVYQQIKGVEVYASVQTLADQVFEALGTYTTALAAARSRAVSDIMAKNLAKAELLKRLDALAIALDTLADGNTQMIVDSGFEVRKTNTSNMGNDLPTPQILKAKSKGNKGELHIQLDNGAPRVVRTHLFAYSLDQGQTWVNGLHHSGRRFTLKGLPNSPELWLKVQSLGLHDKKSEWSEPARAGVL